MPQKGSRIKGVNYEAWTRERAAIERGPTLKRWGSGRCCHDWSCEWISGDGPECPQIGAAKLSVQRE